MHAVNLLKVYTVPSHFSYLVNITVVFCVLCVRCWCAQLYFIGSAIKKTEHLKKTSFDLLKDVFKDELGRIKLFAIIQE
jgi:hypothetical protein